MEIAHAALSINNRQMFDPLKSIIATTKMLDVVLCPSAREELFDIIMALHERVMQIKNSNSSSSSSASAADIGDDDSHVEMVPDIYSISYHGTQVRLIVGDRLRVFSFGHSEPCKWPLASVVTSTFRFDKFRELHRELAPSPELLLLVSWLDTDKLAIKLASSLQRIVSSSNDNDNDQQHAKITKAADLTRFRNNDNNNNSSRRHVPNGEELRSMGITERSSNISFVASGFNVEKNDGSETARFVYNGTAFDDLLDEAVGDTVPKFHINTRDFIIIFLSGFLFMSTCDVKSMFYQFSVHPMLRRFFGIVTDSGIDVLCVLPMGITFSPVFAQTMMEYLIAVALRRAAHRLRGRHRVVVWIDNVIILTELADDDVIIREALDAVFGHVGLVTKGWDTPHAVPKNDCVIGLCVDLEHQRVSPSRKSIEKLDKALQKFIDRPTPANFFRVTGIEMWFAYAGAMPLCFLSDLMAAIRNQARETAYGTPLWHTPSDALASVIDVVRDAANRLRDVVVVGDQRRPEATTQISSDASTQLIAALQRRSSNNAFIMPLLSHHRLILPAELLAGAIASVLLVRPRASWEWSTDNTSAKHAIAKGHTASAIGDRILRWWMRFGNVPVSAVWTPSKCQLADPMTRIDLMPKALLFNNTMLHAGCTICRKAEGDSRKNVPLWTC
ncbi:hypothetical protein EPO17_03640 [Patescibacteria group bacterium]|nr:MAG: hypothetical protein EPO17_03640 [Patescibacteria group bacterium]